MKVVYNVGITSARGHLGEFQMPAPVIFKPFSSRLLVLKIIDAWRARVGCPARQVVIVRHSGRNRSGLSTTCIS